MNLRVIGAIARKDSIDLIKNKQTLITLLTPFIIVIMFTAMEYLFMGNMTPIKIIAYDPNNSQLASILGNIIEEPEIITASSADEVTAQFGANGTQKESDYTIGLIVPETLQADIQANQVSQVKLYTNGKQINQNERQVLERLIIEYGNSIRNPQPSIAVETVTINPPSEEPDFNEDTLSQIYAMMAIVMSFMIATFLVPTLLIEEKEKKTIRMLMTAPISFSDIVLSKLLVGLAYQLLLSLAVTIAMRSFQGNIVSLLVIILVSALFMLSVGLLIGSIFKTTTAANGINGVLIILILMPAIIAGPMSTLMGENPLIEAMKFLPTYYMADGILQSIANTITISSLLFNAGIIIACSIVLTGISIWLLRRQASVIATI